MQTTVHLDRLDGSVVFFTITDNPGAAFVALAGLLREEAGDVMYALRSDAKEEAAALHSLANDCDHYATHNPIGSGVHHSYGWHPEEGGERPSVRLYHSGNPRERTTGRVLFDDIATIKDALRDAADYRRGEWTEEDREADADAESDCATADLYNAVAARLCVEPTEKGTQR